MHIKFTKHGGGSCKKAAAYLLQDKDHSGEVREAVTVLRGDPHAVAAVADSLDFDLKYRSAVISWAPTDQPTPEQIKNVLDDFEKMSLGGLDPARVSMSAVQHDEAGGGVHVHVIIARVDLATGKSYNPSPPGWQKSFDPIRDYHNALNNWARPDDPARARAVSAGRHDLPADVKKAKAIIDADICAGIDAGVIENRADVLAAAADWGEITREGEHYISVKPEGFEKAIRLKGGIYESEFSVRNGTEIEREGGREAGNGTEDRRRRADEAKQSFADALKKRTDYNTHRYQIRDRADSRADSSGLEQDPYTNKTSDPGLDPAGRDRPGSGHRPGSGDMGLELSDNSEYQQQTEDPRGDQRRDRQLENEISEFKFRPAGPAPRARSTQSTRESDKHGRSNLVEKSTGDLAERRWNVDNTTEIGYYMNNSNTELEQFKRDINLVEYAGKCGFKIDPRKSSKHTTVMRSGGDDSGSAEKIAISRGPRGHDIFRDYRVPVGEGGGGTIIDFCQKKENIKSLGQVRQELRSWTGAPRPPASIPRPVPRPAPAVRAAAVAKEKKQLRKITPTSTAAAYLESRGISRRTLQDPRFDNVCTDPRGNACFPHNDGNIFSGCEKKNLYFTGFSPGGDKGLYQSHVPAECDKIIFCESGIDALSHAELHPDNKAAYVSVAGQMSPEQEKQIKDLIERHHDKEIVAAFDNDKAGQQYTADLAKICDETGVSMINDAPVHENQDWNNEIENYQANVDSLKQLRAAYLDEISEYAPVPVDAPEPPAGGLIEEFETLKTDVQQLEARLEAYKEQQELQYQDRGPSMSM
jgi:hypothetical protein